MITIMKLMVVIYIIIIIVNITIMITSAPRSETQFCDEQSNLSLGGVLSV